MAMNTRPRQGAAIAIGLAAGALLAACSGNDAQAGKPMDLGGGISLSMDGKVLGNFPLWASREPPTVEELTAGYAGAETPLMRADWNAPATTQAAR